MFKMGTTLVKHLAPAETAPPTILVVEDDTDLAELFVEALQLEFGAHVLLARTSEETFLLVKAVVPDLLLFEHTLPGMKGLDLYDQLCLNERLRRVPALIIDADGAGSLRSYPHLIHLRKPFDLFKVLFLIRQLLSIPL